MKEQNWTKEELEAAIQQSLSWNEAARRLKLKYPTKKMRFIANKFGIDTSHFTQGNNPKFNKEQLQKAVKESSSIYQVVKKLGLPSGGSNRKTVKKWMDKWGFIL